MKRWCSRMIDKLFLFNPYPCQLTDGGPSGVIAQNVLGHVLHNVDVNPIVPDGLTLRDHLRKKFFPPPVPSFYRNWLVKCEKIYRTFSVAKYRAVFFQDVFSLGCCLHLISPSQIVVLQSHCPELPHQEVAGSRFATEELVDWVRKIEVDAFARADHIVLPNEGAAEIYQPLLSHPSKVVYLTTGARKVAEQGRVGLESSCCNLLFIGRRNRIKGFDLVLEAFRQAHRSRPALRLYLVGRGERVVEQGIIDLGFSENPHLWMNSCDYMINFNRQSYLDLSVLEALSVGTRIITAITGGHREFAGLDTDGIIPADAPSVENLVNILLSKEFVHGKSFVPSLGNIALYQEKFTDEIYRQHLDALASRVLGDMR